MEYLSTFNFDIIIVLVLIASIIAGAYYSLYRQIRKTMILIVPLVALYFVLPPLMTMIKSVSAVYGILEKVFAFIGRFLKLSSYMNIMITGFIGVIAYILMALVIAFIFQIFATPVEKRVLRSTPTFSRVVAGLFGLINGYVLVILLMLFLKPITDINYHRPLTKIIADTSLVYLPVSKLNEVQNVNVTLHQEYQEAFNHLSGDQVANTMAFLDDINNEFIDINTYIDTVMFNQLSADSQTLITTHLTNDDYISSLLTDVDGTLVLQTVLTEEKNNLEIVTINEKLTFIANYRGYWTFFSTLFTNPINTYDYSEIAQIYTDNIDSLTSIFSSIRLQHEFEEHMENLLFFNTYYASFVSILGDGSVTDFASYQTSFQNVMVSSFSDYVTAFVNYPFEASNPVLTSIKYMFQLANKNATNMALLNENMSKPAQIMLANRFEEWFSVPVWEAEVLINSYIKDSLGSYLAGGYCLYHEYFFFQYLSEGITFDDLFSVDDFSQMLTNLETTVNSGLITESQASGFIDGLFLLSDSIIFKLANHEQITNSLYEDIALLNHPYFSENFTTILESLSGE
ncbi:MAG: hypothetical protein AB7V00_01430 [Bacilli bacterium]